MSHSYYRVPVRVHWADTDAAGVAWFGNFFRFFEEAETELFRALGRDRIALMEQLGIFMPRVDASCVFRSPARPEQLLEIGIAVAEIAERRVTYRFEARDHASHGLLAEGSYRIACVRRDTFTSTRVPASLRQLLTSAETLIGGAAAQESSRLAGRGPGVTRRP